MYYQRPGRQAALQQKKAPLPPAGATQGINLPLTVSLNIETVALCCAKHSFQVVCPVRVRFALCQQAERGGTRESGASMRYGCGTISRGSGSSFAHCMRAHLLGNKWRSFNIMVSSSGNRDSFPTQLGCYCSGWRPRCIGATDADRNNSAAPTTTDTDKYGNNHKALQCQATEPALDFDATQKHSL
jgi:hypothetical protein